MTNTNIAILKIYTEETPYEINVSSQFVKSVEVFPESLQANVLYVDLVL